jgi:hypothetical protein
MRSTWKIFVLFLSFALLLIPLVAQAQEPCPDDPDAMKDCVPETPPFYVVINRSFEDLNRLGSGCQPIILEHPECEACCGEDEACLTAEEDLEKNVCPALSQEVMWDNGVDSILVYQMCCDCSQTEEGAWTYRVRLLNEDGTCPIDPNNPGCYEGLPPGTGIDLPAPIVIGGLAFIGMGLLAGGMMLRRRGFRPA